MNKIFGIGFPKTGSRSLAEFLSRLGYKTFHDGLQIEPSFGKMEPDPLRGSKPNEGQFYTTLSLDIELDTLDWDCFVNRYQNYYDLFDSLYPQSKFILTTRSFDSWYRSFGYHLKRHHIAELMQDARMAQINYQPLSSSAYFFDLLGVLNFRDLQSSKLKQHIQRRYDKHTKNVTSYFNDSYAEPSSRLLVLDLEESNQEKATKLLSFLEREEDLSRHKRYPHFYADVSPREEGYKP